MKNVFCISSKQSLLYEEELKSRNISVYIYEPEISGFELSFKTSETAILGTLKDFVTQDIKGSDYLSIGLTKLDSNETKVKEIRDTLAYGACRYIAESGWSSVKTPKNKFAHIFIIVYRMKGSANAKIRRAVFNLAELDLNENGIDELIKSLIDNDKKDYPQHFSMAKVLPIKR